MNINTQSLAIEELERLRLEGALTKKNYYKLACLYTAIAYKTANGKKVSNQELANILGVHRQTIVRQKKILVDLGIISEKVHKPSRSKQGKVLSPLNTYTLLKSEYARFKKAIRQNFATVKEFLGESIKKKGRNVHCCKACGQYKVTLNTKGTLGFCYDQSCNQGYRQESINWWGYEKLKTEIAYFWGKRQVIYLV